jgi:hypothetical protein
MFSHADTVCSLGELDDQELLRTAAQQRLAATADTAPRPHDPMTGSAHGPAPSSSCRLLRPPHRLRQECRTSGGAPSARPVA